MSEQTKATLKSYFITGAVPTQPNFEDLIDTLSVESTTDASIARLDAYNLIQDASIAAGGSGDVSKVYVDSSLAFRDSSISDLDVLTQTNITGIATNVTNIGYADSSISDLDVLTQSQATNINQLDSSIIRVDSSIVSIYDSLAIIISRLDGLDASIGDIGTAIDLINGV